jgi:hypothetical protein
MLAIQTHPGTEEVPPGDYTLRIARLGNYPYGRRFRPKGAGVEVARTAIDITVPDGGQARADVVLTERPLRRVRRATFWFLLLGLLLWLALLDDVPTRPESKTDADSAIFLGLYLMVVIAAAFATINHVRRQLREYGKRAPTPVSRNPYTYVADLLVIAGFVLGSALCAILMITGLADAGQIDVVRADSSVASARDVVFGVFWHMADALPAVGIASVWDWKNPAAVRGDLAWLADLPLVAMRLLVAAGVIGFVLDCWNALTTPRAAATSQEN